MDPLADKMLVMAAMCYFVECGQMPGWALALVLLREFAVSGMRLVAATGADNNMQLGGVEHFARKRDLGIRWRGATFGNSGAQLYTSCASSLSCKATLQAVGAYFKFK